MNYHYIAFGLKIESEFEIPEFLLSEGAPDVYIGVGEVPEKLPNPLFEGVRFQASPDHFLLHVDHIAGYFAEGGHTITVQPYSGSSDSEIRLFLLGSVFGALIHQRGLLPVHGSSLCIDQKAYIFSGISGAGKSTLAAGLMQRGYQLLSDDISVVSMDKHPTPFVYAGYPGMKLWADSMLKLGFKPENYIKVREKLNKHHLNIGPNFNPEGMPLKGIYMLQTRNSDGILIEPIKGIEKFNALKNNTYRLNFIKGIGNTESHFRHLTAIATSCNVKRISRSLRGFDLNLLLDKIEEDIKCENGDSKP